MIELKKIGIVKSTRREIRDDNWDSENSYIELDLEQFDSSSLEGLTDFSHAEIIFYMDQVKTEKIVTKARHPRNNKQWPKVGIFAQRTKNRPNRIGLCICKVQKVEENRLYLEGLDAIDNTPVLDIKPWVQEFGPRGEKRQPSWISELMLGYWSSDE